MKYYIKVIENKNVVTKKHTENIKNNGKNAVLSMASLSQRYNISVRKRDIRENSTALKKPKTLYIKLFLTQFFVNKNPKSVKSLVSLARRAGEHQHEKYGQQLVPL